MKLFLALILFLIGLIIAIVTAVKYSKAKKKDGDNIETKPYVIKISVVFVLFVVSQILLILNR